MAASLRCWGHRGGTDMDYPENSLASFEAALRAGADGIESDVRLLTDGVVVLHHDAIWGHTVEAKGTLTEWAWKDGVEHLRLKGDPTATIPRLEELLALFMQPEFSHAVFNIDCKPQNPAESLMAAVHAKVVEVGGPDYLKTLGDRLVLSIYSDIHLKAAEKHMPYAKRVHLGSDLAKAREVFDRVDGFSMFFSNLALPGGERTECRQAGKSLAVWTVNTAFEWLECARLGIDVVITDRCDAFRDWQRRVADDDRSQKRMVSSNSSLSTLQLVYETYKALDCVVWQRQMIKDAYVGVPVQKTPVLSPKFIMVLWKGGKKLGEPEPLDLGPALVA